MAKRKVLKSVARSVADSFLSTLNYMEDDYVMGHLLLAARKSGETKITVNLLTGEAVPKQLVIRQVARAIPLFTKKFPDIVNRSGSSISFVHSAELFVRYDMSSSRPLKHNPSILESSYECGVKIVDDEGKEHVAILTGWWYPEPRVRLPLWQRCLQWLRVSTGAPPRVIGYTSHVSHPSAPPESIGEDD